MPRTIAAAPNEDQLAEPAPIASVSARQVALAIRQPFCELILRGDKRCDFRSRPTRIRGRILLYAGLGRYTRDMEADLAEEFGIDLAEFASFPRGVIVGSAELFNCDVDPDGAGWRWWLRRVTRATTQRKVERHPTPTWFYPFRDS
jgi:hypothetical protein